MKTTMNKITGKDIGIVIDCSADSADRLNVRTWELALVYGMTPSPEDAALIDRYHAGEMEDDDSQNLSEMGDDAVSYLNGLDLPAYCAFHFEDNSLFLTPDVDGAREDVGFVSSKTQDYPEDDYRGEWLHVSDHGNATLYVRGEDGKDTEIWGVV